MYRRAKRNVHTFYEFHIFLNDVFQELYSCFKCNSISILLLCSLSFIMKKWANIGFVSTAQNYIVTLDWTENIEKLHLKDEI